MLARELRLLACVGAVASTAAAAYGCSLVIDTDGLTGGTLSPPDLDASRPALDASPGAPVTGSALDSGEPMADAANSGTACPGGDTVGTSTSCGACGFDCGGGSCADGVCQPVAMAIAGQGRAIIAFSSYGLVWSSVTARTLDPADACAPVAPQVFGLAANATLLLPDGGTDDSSVFSVSVSGPGASYASALSDDRGGLYFQDTAPMAGVLRREVGFGNVKVAATVSGQVFGVAEPPAGNVAVFFADSVATPGPHEYGTGAGNVDSTTTLPLDPSGPAELHTAYQTAALAVDPTWAYYGTAAGVYRIRLGATCTGGGSSGDAGRGDAGAGCEVLFLVERETNTVTVLMADAQYLFVGTVDGALTRYDIIDGSNPVVLSTGGPFYGLTQDVDTVAATVAFGTTVYATSTKGPILEIAKDGSSLHQVATSPYTPLGITVAGDTLYWVEDGQRDPTTQCALGNGRLMRVRR